MLKGQRRQSTGGAIKDKPTTKDRPIRLNYFFRKPRTGETYSIERVFDAIIAELPSERFAVRRLVCPFHSAGLIRRVLLIFWAALNQGDINHITGDVDFLCLLMKKRRTVVTIHDAGSLHRLRGLRRRAYELFWLRLPLLRAGLLMTGSEATCKELEPFATRVRTPIEVVPHCMTIPLEAERKQFRSELPRILHIGTKPNKNLKRVIAALKGIACELVVIGKLTQEQSRLLARSGIRYENYVDLSDRALIEQYRAADLLVFASTYEGFGLPILEAQAVGRVVVTSNREPMRSVAGTGAKLVDPVSVEELRRGVQDVIQNARLRRTLIRAGTANVKRYSPARVASHYASLYQKMYKAALQ